MEHVIKNIDFNYEYFLDIYIKKGYVLIENVYTDEEIFKINNIYQLNKYNESCRRDIYHNKILRVEELIKTNKEINNIVLGKIYNFLEKILGPNFQLFKDKIIEKHTDTINNFDLHMDGIFKTHNYRLNKETLGWWTYSKLFANINVMLTDNTIENGALRIASNSYNQNQNDLNKIIEEKIVDKRSGIIIKDIDKIKEKCESICGKKGYILIFNPLCPHYSGNNISNNIRRNIYLTYCSETDNNIYDLFNNDKDLIIKNIGLEKFQKESLNEEHLIN